MHYFPLGNMLRRVWSPFTLILLFSLHFIEIPCLSSHALEVVPERVEIIYGNNKYVKNIKSYVRRYGRRSPYVSHLEAELQQQFGNNVSITIILYEYLHNEYKRSFVEFHFKLCDFFNKDEFVGTYMRSRGIICPVPRGHWNISNVRLEFPLFPYVFPIKRAKCAVTIKVVATEDIIAMGNYYVFFKQK